MYEPAEMIRKIEELEKGLPAGNRPETLYARAALLQAETQAKLLFVFIDISKKFDRLIDLYSLSQPATISVDHSLVLHRLEDLESRLHEIHPYLTPAKRICRKCQQEIQYLEPIDEGKVPAFACGCTTVMEGEFKPDYWPKTSGIAPVHEGHVCIKCNDEVQVLQPRDGGPRIRTCNCDDSPSIMPGDIWPVSWITPEEFRERYGAPAATDDPRIKDLVEGNWSNGKSTDPEIEEEPSTGQTEGRQQVSAPNEPEKSIDLGGLGEFNDERKTGGDEETKEGDSA